DEKPCSARFGYRFLGDTSPIRRIRGRSRSGPWSAAQFVKHEADSCGQEPADDRKLQAVLGRRQLRLTAREQNSRSKTRQCPKTAARISRASNRVRPVSALELQSPQTQRPPHSRPGRSWWRQTAANPAKC